MEKTKDMVTGMTSNFEYKIVINVCKIEVLEGFYINIRFIDFDNL